MSLHSAKIAQPIIDHLTETESPEHTRNRRHLHAVPAPKPLRAAEISRSPVPDIPAPDLNIVRLLAVYSFEILDGSRAVSQLGGWITREVAEHLTQRRAARTERRTLTRDDRRTVPIPGPVHLSRPSPMVIEVTIVLRTEVRATAVAMRLEYLRERWRATNLTVL